MFETNGEDTQVVTDPHSTEKIEKEQVDIEITALRKKVEAGETSKYAIHERGHRERRRG